MNENNKNYDWTETIKLGLNEWMKTRIQWNHGKPRTKTKEIIRFKNEKTLKNWLFAIESQTMSRDKANFEGMSPWGQILTE